MIDVIFYSFTIISIYTSLVVVLTLISITFNHKLVLLLKIISIVFIGLTIMIGVKTV